MSSNYIITDIRGALMADISNKSLALILLVAVVVSMTGTLYTLDRMEGSGVVGYAVMNQSGKSNFSINSSLSIRFVDMTTVQFGAGYVNDTIPSAECVINSTMTSAQVLASGVSGCIGFNDTISSRNLTIENDGNILANVTLNFTANATNFIGGTNPTFQYFIRNNETGSCGTVMNGSTWTEVNVSALGYRVCNLMNYSDTNDTFQIALGLQIPKTASPGAHTVNIYAIACDDNSC